MAVPAHSTPQVHDAVGVDEHGWHCVCRSYGLPPLLEHERVPAGRFDDQPEDGPRESVWAVRSHGCLLSRLARMDRVQPLNSNGLHYFFFPQQPLGRLDRLDRLASPGGSRPSQWQRVVLRGYPCPGGEEWRAHDRILIGLGKAFSPPPFTPQSRLLPQRLPPRACYPLQGCHPSEPILPSSTERTHPVFMRVLAQARARARERA